MVKIMLDRQKVFPRLELWRLSYSGGELDYYGRSVDLLPHKSIGLTALNWTIHLATDCSRGNDAVT